MSRLRERALDLAAPLVLPAVLTAVGLLVMQVLVRLDAGQLAVAAWLPVALFAAGWWACLRFNRTRLGFTLAALSLTYIVLLGMVPELEAPTARLVAASLAVLLPLDLVGFALWHERGDLGSAGDVRWVVLSAEIAAVLGLALGPVAGVNAWLDWRPADGLLSTAALGLPALAVWVVTLTLLGARLVSHPTAQRGALFAVAVLACGVLTVATPAATVALLGIGAAILTVTALQEGWGLAYLDTLTELPGRRALDEALARQHARYAVAMLDVDHFKKFNDTHGHHVGDEVLRMVASFLREVGGGGRPFRYGGEEFTVLFPGLRAEDALPHLEKLREAIAEAAFALRRHDRRGSGSEASVTVGEPLSITISIGVADSDEGRRRTEAVLGLADEALYAAKRGGRNRCQAHGAATDGA